MTNTNNNKENMSAVIRLRLTPKLKEDFQTKCNMYSINPSDLIRKWIEKYTYYKKDE